MYDTIRATTITHAIDLDVFDGSNEMRNRDSYRLRLWRNPSEDKYEPRLSYWPASGLLQIEFSVSKLSGADPGDNINQVDTWVTVGAVDRWLSSLFDRGVGGSAGLNPATKERRPAPPSLAPFRSWRVTRIDYAWNWNVDRPDQWIALARDVSLSGHDRHDYQRDAGVMWSNKRSAVKFYDKSRESGLSRGVLRFEVSNQAERVRYMCERWFQCEQTVEQCLHQGRALYLLSRSFDKFLSASPRGEAFTTLSFPTKKVLSAGENLKNFSLPPSEEGQKILWEKLALSLELGAAPISEFLVRSVSDD